MTEANFYISGSLQLRVRDGDDPETVGMRQRESIFRPAESVRELDVLSFGRSSYSSLCRVSNGAAKWPEHAARNDAAAHTDA